MSVPETLTANGLNLLSRVHRTTELSGLLTIAGRRTDDIDVPGRHGMLRTPRKRYDRLELVLPLWVHGLAADGTIPVGSSAAREFYGRVNEIVAAFGRDTVDLVHGLPDGSGRRIVGEILASVDPTRHMPGQHGQLAYKLVCADPFWADLNSVTSQVTTTGGPTTWVLTPFAGASAPMDDLMLTLTATAGTVPNPRVQQGAVYVEYLDSLTTGRSVQVNSATWTLAGGGGLVADYARLRKGGGEPRYFSLTPGATLTTAPQVQVSHTGTGTLTAALTGRRRHLVG